MCQEAAGPGHAQELPQLITESLRVPELFTESLRVRKSCCKIPNLQTSQDLKTSEDLKTSQDLITPGVGFPQQYFKLFSPLIVQCPAQPIY